MSSFDRRQQDSDFRARVDRVRAEADIVAIVGAVVKLGRGGKPRGKCPFHGSKSDSFSVDPGKGYARCYGCDWHGDAIRFLQDYYNLPFREAFDRVASASGVDGLTAAPLVREKAASSRRDSGAPPVSSLEMARWIWMHSAPDFDAVYTWLRARGVPDDVLTPHRLRDIRFAGLAPIWAWPEDRSAGDVPQAPAMVALVRAAPGGARAAWRPIGLHVTYLAPSLDAKMVRRRADGSAMRARKMLGSAAGGCVLLPAEGVTHDAMPECAPIAAGEGIETTLCGIGVAGGAGVTGVAVLSLQNLQGMAERVGKDGAIAMFDPRPADPPAPQAVAWAHRGPVTILVDADMAPLTGPIDRASGKPRGVAMIERRRGAVVHRTMTTAERARLCGALAVRAWRARGADARAVRPPMGMDFNDSARLG
ncbi:CHC2 zinc finger domain-containing protein [Sphingosinithalassobacter portus]|uniref:CHC2 zinc finger domain-containing protein n=1 Tax=Stakelama portus TaxID=2676234 RepID=UPI000D6E9E78|nr:CHC2 zinc finger domain-containing protein [Sphingosinithalassobacter portus]